METYAYICGVILLLTLNFLYRQEHEHKDSIMRAVVGGFRLNIGGAKVIGGNPRR